MFICTFVWRLLILYIYGTLTCNWKWNNFVWIRLNIKHDLVRPPTTVYTTSAQSQNILECDPYMWVPHNVSCSSYALVILAFPCMDCYNGDQKCLSHKNCTTVVQKTKNMSWVPRKIHLVKFITWNSLMFLDSCIIVVQESCPNGDRYSMVKRTSTMKFLCRSPFPLMQEIELFSHYQTFKDRNGSNLGTL